MAALGPRCCAWALPSCCERGSFLTVVRGLLVAVASLLRSTGSRRAGLSICGTWAQLWHMGLVALRHVGIFPDQGWNLCPLRWQADSQPLCYQGSPHRQHFNSTWNNLFHLFLRWFSRFLVVNTKKGVTVA